MDRPYMRVIGATAPEDVPSGHDFDHESSYGSGGHGGGGDMTDRLERLEKKVDSIEITLSRLNETMIRMDGKLDRIYDRFDVIEKRFDAVDKRFDSTSKSITEKVDNAGKLTEANTKTIIADAKLAIILAIPTIIGAAYTAYRLLSKQ